MKLCEKKSFVQVDGKYKIEKVNDGYVVETFTIISTCVTKSSTFQVSFEKQHVCLRYYENYQVSVIAAKTSRFERFAMKSSTFRL